MRTLLADKTADITIKNAYKVIVAEFQRQSKPITSDEVTLKILTQLKKGEIELLTAKALNNTSPFLTLLEKYLPKQVDREEVVGWIKANVDLTKFRSPMQAIGIVMKEFKGVIDGNIVKDCILELSK